MKAVAYIRVSNAEEAEDPDAVERQRTAIEEYCSANDMELADVFIDHAGIGFSDKRPELERILNGEVPEGTKAVVVSSTDRVAANVKAFLFLHQKLMSRAIDLKCAEDNSGETGAGKFAPMLGRA